MPAIGEGFMQPGTPAWTLLARLKQGVRLR